MTAEIDSIDDDLNTVELKTLFASYNNLKYIKTVFDLYCCSSTIFSNGFNLF